MAVRADAPSGSSTRRGSAAVAGLALCGLAGLVLAMSVGGDLPKATALSGISEAPLGIQWGLPITRTAADLLAVVTVGLLLAAAALVPSARDLLSTAAVRAARLAAWLAWAWALLALLVLVLSYADIFATDVEDAVNPRHLMSFVGQSDQAAAWLLTASFAAFAGVVARESNQPLGAWSALVLAVAAVVPPALTGHAAAAGSHDLASSSLVLHLMCAVLWVGGLLALLWYATTDGRYLSLAASRFSALALWVFVGVGVSGAANALVRLDGLSNLFTTRYGAVVLLKVVAFVALGMLGWAHRRHSLVELHAGRRAAFTRLAAVEAAIMVATVGVAVGLSITSPPGGVTTVPSPAEVLLGVPVPGPPTFTTLFGGWRLDLMAAAALAVAAITYGRGVRRLHRRGDSWPVGRAIAWYGGLAVIAVCTLSGFALYGRTAFSLHMTQHMVLSMIAPLLLVLGAPLTLAVRALPAAASDQPSGPREWLLAALHSPVARVLTHPITAFVLFVMAPYMIYFSGLFEVAMRNHWAHELMHVHFVLVGYLFFEALIGRDPIPYRASYPMRMVMLFASLAVHAFFAVALISSGAVIANSYYQTLARPWWTDLLRDQTQGASFAWAFGELPAIIVLVVLSFQWSREDDRRARQADRQADRDGDAELAAYNRMLAARRDESP